MEQNTETRVADTLLQREVEITAGGKTYRIAPPSVATLVLVSEAVSRLPHIRLDEDKIIHESLHIAKDFRELGDIVAILILGARHINDTEKRQQKRRVSLLWGLIKYTRTETKTVSLREELREEMMQNLTPRELNSLVGQAITKMQVGDFFGLTTFLTEINLTRPTKVGTEATAYGQ